MYIFFIIMYKMEYTVNMILGFLFGLFLKIYDDIIDNKFNLNNYYIDFLKYFVITLFSIIFFNDAIFSIVYFEMTLLSLLMDKYYSPKFESFIKSKRYIFKSAIKNVSACSFSSSWNMVLVIIKFLSK